MHQIYPLIYVKYEYLSGDLINRKFHLQEKKQTNNKNCLLLEQLFLTAYVA